MYKDFLRNFGKIFNFVEPKYLGSIAIGIMALMGVGIGNTLLNPVDMPEASLDESKSEASKSEFPKLVVRPKPVSVQSSIGKGNIFRHQRTDFKVPPPPPPPPPPPKRLEKTEYLTEGIKLLGTIITDDTRIAILEAEVTESVRELVEIEVDTDQVLSGVRQGKKGKDGKFYETVSVESEKVSLARQSYREGDKVSNYIIERVLEDRIEVAHMRTGRKEIVYLEVIYQDAGDLQSDKAGELKGERPARRKAVEEERELTDMELSGVRSYSSR